MNTFHINQYVAANDVLFHITVRNSQEEINEHIYPTCFAFLTPA